MIRSMLMAKSPTILQIPHRVFNQSHVVRLLVISYLKYYSIYKSQNVKFFFYLVSKHWTNQAFRLNLTSFNHCLFSTHGCGAHIIVVVAFHVSIMGGSTNLTSSLHIRQLLTNLLESPLGPIIK